MTTSSNSVIVDETLEVHLKPVDFQRNGDLQLSDVDDYCVVEKRHLTEAGNRNTNNTMGVTKVEPPLGLLNSKALVVLVLWYFFSFVTLFLNKYILATLQTDTVFFATMQMLVTTALGYFNMHYPCYMYTPTKNEGASVKPPNFYRNMLIVGSTRFLVVFLGLIALKYVPVSFTETVKSSAPLFTVFMSRMMLGEKNGVFVQCSLIPIMSGLALCSMYELSFDIRGFVAALGTNISECLQFVCSKLCISGEKYKITPAEFQFYTCMASVLLQTPVALLLVDYQSMMATDRYALLLILINGISYHYQTMMAWVLMGFVSPVTHSVCNTVKRAILIWLSILIFGNPITLLGSLGTVIVIFGVLVYNKARHFEQSKRDMVVRYTVVDNPAHKDVSQL